MPYFRGIDMSIVASNEAKKLEEYPHEHGSSVRLMGVATDSLKRIHGGIKPSASYTSTLSDSDPTRHRKVEPRVSVYICSKPGKCSQWVTSMCATNSKPFYSSDPVYRATILVTVLGRSSTSTTYTTILEVSILLQNVHERKPHRVVGY
jgi:hypothetical protein